MIANLTRGNPKQLSRFCLKTKHTLHFLDNEKNFFVAFAEDDTIISSITHFENHVSYFVQKRRKNIQ